jgi:hypothetical protein
VVSELMFEREAGKSFGRFPNSLVELKSDEISRNQKCWVV